MVKGLENAKNKKNHQQGWNPKDHKTWTDHIFKTLSEKELADAYTKIFREIKDKPQTLVGSLLQHPMFLKEQQLFIDLYCNEFDIHMGRTLTHLTVYKLYIEMIEKLAEDVVGKEENLLPFIAGLRVLDKKMIQNSEAWTEPLAQLYELLKYENFEAQMTERRQEELNGKPGRQGRSGDLSMAKVTSYFEEVQQAYQYKSMPGWHLLVQDEDFEVRQKFDLRSDRKGSIVLTTMNVQLSPHSLAMRLMGLDKPWWHAQELNCNDWKVEETVDMGPFDKIFTLDAMKPYDVWSEGRLMATNALIPVRVTVFPNSPEPGMFGYLMAPFDMVRNVRRRQFGPIKAKVGLVAPLSYDAGETLLCKFTTLETTTFDMRQSHVESTPKFEGAEDAINRVYEQLIATFHAKVELFKASSLYEDSAADERNDMQNNPGRARGSSCSLPEDDHDNVNVEKLLSQMSSMSPRSDKFSEAPPEVEQFVVGK